MNKILQVDDVEVIRIEYALTVADLEPIKDFGEVRTLLEVYRDDTIDCLEGCKRSINRERLCRLRNNIQRLVGYYSEDEDELSETEMSILHQKESLAKQFNSYFTKLAACVTEGNYSEVCGLAIFTNKKYLSNLNYLDDLHKGVDLACSGISYQGRGTNDQKAFQDFLEKKLRDLHQKNKNQK